MLDDLFSMRADEAGRNGLFYRSWRDGSRFFPIKCCQFVLERSNYRIRSHETCGIIGDGYKAMDPLIESYQCLLKVFSISGLIVNRR